MKTDISKPTKIYSELAEEYFKTPPKERTAIIERFRDAWTARARVVPSDVQTSIFIRQVLVRAFLVRIINDK